MKQLKFIRNLLILSVIVLLGCSTRLTHLQLSKQDFQTSVDKANAGDIIEISYVRHNYCLGYSGYFHTSSGKKEHHVLFKNEAQCEIWTKKHLDLFQASSDPSKIAATTSSYNYYGNAGFYFKILRELVISDKKSQYDAQKLAIINEVAAIDSLQAKKDLFEFYSYYYRHDKDKIKRLALSQQLCPITADKEYCSFYAYRLYQGGDFLQSLALYEKYGTYSKYDQRRLAQLYINPPQGKERKPAEAIKLLSTAYDGNQGFLTQCYEKKSKSHKDCIALVDRRDKAMAQARVEQAFLSDESLSREIREDKYKLALTQYLKAKEYAQALVYFDFLDRIDYKLPSSMIYFKAEALFHTNQMILAKKNYQYYLAEYGKKGSYYRQSLKRLNEMDNQ